MPGRRIGPPASQLPIMIRDDGWSFLSLVGFDCEEGEFSGVGSGDHGAGDVVPNVHEQSGHTVLLPGVRQQNSVARNSEGIINNGICCWIGVQDP